MWFYNSILIINERIYNIKKYFERQKKSSEHPDSNQGPPDNR